MLTTYLGDVPRATIENRDRDIVPNWENVRARPLTEFLIPGFWLKVCLSLISIK